MSRIIALSIENNNNKLSQIHAVEIIDYIITGKYFHCYLISEKDYMYYLSDYGCKINYIDNFTKFVGNSKIITMDDTNDQIFKNFNIKKIDVDLKNEINKYGCHGIVKCTILGRYICEKKI